MIGRLFEHLDEIGRRVGAAPSLLVFLDFDGTLTPIVDTPDMVKLSPSMRETLIKLCDRQQGMAVVISGRDRADVQSHVKIPGLVYAGNHGLEISGPGFIFVEPTAVEHRPQLQEVAADLKARLQPFAGAFVEDKGLTLSVHYRLAAPELVEEIRRTVHAALAKASHPFVLTTGDKVYEIRPRVNWNKGTAVAWIAEQLKKKDALIIYLGDDATDEDAFAALPDGITIKVGAQAETAAQYQLDGPAEVEEFLEWLASLFA